MDCKINATAVVKTLQLANQSAMDRGQISTNDWKSFLSAEGPRVNQKSLAPGQTRLRLYNPMLRQCKKPFVPLSAKTFCAVSKALWARSADLTSVPENAPKFSPRCLSLYFVGPKKYAKNSRRIPRSLRRFPAKNQEKFSDELLQARRENILYLLRQ